MARTHLNRTGGFTLVELMIVVAIIGVLASVAIPSYLNYQLTAKRSEAFANLSSLAKAQKSYFAEFNDYIAVPSEPYGALTLLPTSVKRDSTSIAAAFASVGWTPEGDVYYDYDTATATTPLGGDCGSCTEGCFTSTAYGDLDGDGDLSLLVYAHPNAVGDYCSTGVLDLAPVNLASQTVHDEVIRVAAGDEY